ncbi:MAG: radical SAM protein [Caldiserica bacterium]|nr:radical SAM protein [Caldisericota bacterium]
MITRIKGIIEGGDIALLGPRVLELSISAVCDSSCLACWCHSPLLKDSFHETTKKRFLPLNKIEEFIGELLGLGLEEVQLSGAGEPLLHPHFWEIVEFLKDKGLKVHIITNFLSVKKKELYKFLELRVDSITISIWAGTPETYVSLHPNRCERDFSEISQKIRLLVEEREKSNLFYPKIKIYHVLTHLNADEIEEMLEHSLSVGADMLEFKAVDTIPGRTDFLSFTREDIKKIGLGIEKLKNRIDFPYPEAYDPYEAPHLQIFSDYSLRREIVDYGRYLKKAFLPREFTLILDKSNPTTAVNEYVKLHCPEGKGNHRSILKESPEQAFYFFYFREYCKDCKRVKKCFAGEEIKEVKLSYLSFMGGGRLERELESFSQHGNYGTEVVDKIPCYAGWLYLRIETDGSVIPCCKGHKFPVGNIFKKSFQEIWNGEKERKFRSMGKELVKSSPLFQLIGCRKGCDNIGMNVSFHAEVLKG